MHVCAWEGHRRGKKRKSEEETSEVTDFWRKAQKSSMKKSDDTVEKRKGKMVKNIRKNDTEEDAENKRDCTARDSAAVQPCRTTVSYEYHLTVIDGPYRYVSPTPVPCQHSR